MPQYLDIDGLKSYHNKLKETVKVSPATTSDAGIVKPDGTTITVDATGTISAQKLDVDTKPTKDSDNPVSSGGVYDAISAISSLKIVVVETLPTTDISTDTIYFVPKTTSGTDNIYSEYIYVNGKWELIGDTEVDLSEYLAKDDVGVKILSTEGTNIANITISGTTYQLYAPEGGGSGSLGAYVKLTTTDSFLYNKTVILSCPYEEVTATFGADGTCTATAHYLSTYTISCETAKNSVEVTAIGAVYEITLNRDNSVLTVNTSSSDLTSQTLTITKDGAEVGTTTFGTGFRVFETGDYVFSVTATGGRSTSITINVTELNTTYSATINTAGIKPTTAASDLSGQPITITYNGTALGTVNFGGEFRVFDEGTYTLTTTATGGATVTRTVSVSPLCQDYTVAINGATIMVTTESDDLTGRTVTIKKGGTTVGTTTFGTGFRVFEAGTYICSATNADGDTYESSNVVISTLENGTFSTTIDSLKLVSFSTGTDKEITNMINAYYNNKLTISDIKSVWSVGDTRNISLSAMSATGVGESHHADTYAFTILDFEHDTLTTAVNGHTKALITIQTMRILSTAGRTYQYISSYDSECGYMNSSDTNSGGWSGCARRTWCNNVFREALPSYIKSLNKQVVKYSGTGGGSSSGTQTTNDYVFLLSEIEIFGSTTYSVSGEGSKYSYFSSTDKRYKLPAYNSSYSSAYWWERSPYSGSSGDFCVVSVIGSAYFYGASGTLDLAPALSL